MVGIVWQVQFSYSTSKLLITCASLNLHRRLHSMWLPWRLLSQINTDCSSTSCVAGLQIMAAYWRFWLWSCCPMDGPTWTPWAATDSGCSREATEMVTTRPTSNTWRTSRSGTKRATFKQRSMKIPEQPDHQALFLSGQRQWVGAFASSPWQCLPADSGMVSAPWQPHTRADK